MATSRSNGKSRFAPLRWLGALWWFLDASRRLVLNLLFLLLLVIVIVAIATSGPPRLQDKTALVLNLRGPLVEQRAMSLRGTAMSQLSGNAPQATQLRDVLTVLDAAALDPKINRVVLMLDEFKGAGLPALREVGAALTRVKAAGKPVTAWGSGFDQRQYLVAVQANEVLMHPMGVLMIQGLGGHRNYYRDALDKLGVSVNVVRVGTYKNFGEPFTANAPSPEAAEAEAFVYNAMWATYTEAVEKARVLPEGTVMALINELPARLAAADGDPARLVLSAKLIDGLKTRDELREWLLEHDGEPGADGKGLRQISFDDYLARQKPRLSGDAIGVVVAEGEIVDGVAPAGAVGGLSTAELVRRAREDKSIKAVVLRVNSPGGSAFGSELVRRELELTRAAGKPVVVSMGDVAASGGYWISMAADEVMADAATITGSIGVLAVMPRVDKVLDKLGVHTAGTTTTWLVGVADPRRPLDPRFAELLQTSMKHVYADFTGKVAQARKSTPEKIDAVAQGRVWTGAQAKERGLVDSVGGLRAALASAAVRAKLGEDPRVVYIEAEPGRTERLLSLLGGPPLAQALLASWLPDLGVMPQAVQEAQRELGWLTELMDQRKPFAALAHCFCEAPF